AGLQGNDKALVSTVETWIAQDIKMVVLSRHSSPKDGETITKLVNIRRAEPDQTLFQVPSTYRIVDEDGRFTIEVARARGDVNGGRDDEQSIRKMLAAFADARNALDARGMAAAYADDAEFLAFDDPPITGRPAIERGLIAPVTKGGGRMERSLKGVRLIRPDLAVAEGDVHFSAPNSNMNFVEHYVLRKNAGRWQILFQRYINSE
ncbi:MAG TPA: SgcJ/EcaC family oxidoreductase, partial [Bryobacteraceae bacterium]